MMTPRQVAYRTNSEIFDDGKVVKGFWIPWMLNEVIMCDNYKEASKYASGVAGCTEYTYTKTYDPNNLIIQKGVVTIIAIINNAIYNRIRIPIVLGYT